ncbi:MAG: glycerate kinase [Ignavibacteriae bacterium]|nr:glycerate kinase [Ignavibacteriota bacterium]
MRLVAPTAFKGTMSPLEAARHLALPGDRLLPLSDGGDGFLECLRYALGGQFQECIASDPFGRMRTVQILELPDGTVAVESAKVIGLAGLDHLDPFRASSRGLGELLATLQSSRRLWIGLGGTATMDGGKDWPTIKLSQAIVFCDVRTDLDKAAEMFGPQKGAKPDEIPVLRDRLMAVGLPTGPFTGAAGGLGAKLLALGAKLVAGADEFLEVVGFDDHCRDCDAVVTGEGCLDKSTLEGKLPSVVSRRARQLGLKVIGRFGSKGEGWETAAQSFDGVVFGVEPKVRVQY